MRAQPSRERMAYWWLDEIRTASFALSKARTGRVATWPRMTVPAGSGTLPLPKANGAVEIDGLLDEPAWQQATRFPVGPIFGPWRDGPFWLMVSAWRDEKRVYLAVQSERSLTDLGALVQPGELFRAAGRPISIHKGKSLTGGAVKVDGQKHILEMVLPFRGKSVSLSFPVEIVRRSGGKLPSELASLGLTKLGRAGRRSRRRSSVWLEPIAVNLVPSDASAQLTWLTEARLSHVLEANGKSVSKGEYPVQPGKEDGVSRFHWQAKWKGLTCQLEGFRYVEPVVKRLAAVRGMHQRSPSDSAADPATENQAEEIQRMEERLRTIVPNPGNHGRDARATMPKDRAAWRELYCRAREMQSGAHLSMLDGPLLFVKRHPYFAGHIYDDYYTWRPGGGIYVFENPDAAFAKRKVRAVIDPKTKPTLGGGVYRDPEISWDGKRVLFACKSDRNAGTSIYEIGADGHGLRQLSTPEKFHDITPCYLPDGRIVFTSTRPRGLVPCNNTGVDSLHTMNADGSAVRSISYNNVNEFDPSVLHDGRIMYGRWEYVDKTALYMQSLWTVFPDGTNETALFANNLAKPTAILDARPVPGTNLIAASLTPHNGQAAGAIAMIDPLLGKNNLQAVTNFTPEYPVRMDQGLTIAPCDPWPLSKDDVLISNNAIGAHGILELVDRFGHRELVYCDPDLSCYSPMLVRPRRAPTAIPAADPADEPGRFLLLDVYRGLKGVKRGTVKRLRVIEETARISPVPPGGRWWNQAFLVSWQGSYVVKNFLGTVPVYPDGSAHFEVPPGRAVYFEALDADGREVQRMRTFVQAVPGVTRSCVGCHENKMTTTTHTTFRPMATQRQPSALEPESWGSGYIDYPTMIQPILDRHCVQCHGGEKGIEGGIDLSGGWTWAFNISYETLLKNNLAGYLRCHNGDVTTSDILPPRTLGSGSAPLADLLVDGHDDRLPDLTRPERDLLMAWMDGNSNYNGTWNYTRQATCRAILSTASPLSGAMQAAGCTQCHTPRHIGNDWVNLEHPEWSRVLRAPLAKTNDGPGLAWCRKRKAKSGLPLVTQRQLPPDVFRPPHWPERDPSGEVHTTFASTSDKHYQAILKIIRKARSQALASPRVDMPGAEVTAGARRLQIPMPLPDPLPVLKASLTDDAVKLSWPRTAETLGMQFILYRSAEADFAPDDKALLAETTLFQYTDTVAPEGTQHYALVLLSGAERSKPIRTSIKIPRPSPPPVPAGLAARPGPGQVVLSWTSSGKSRLRFNVYRARTGSKTFRKINEEPLLASSFVDAEVEKGVKHDFTVRALSRRGVLSEPASHVTAAPLPEIKAPVFTALFSEDTDGKLVDGSLLKGRRHGKAKLTEKSLDLRQGGHVTFAHRQEFDLNPRLSIECRIYFDEAGQMPVIISCGRWRGTGWFLQRIGAGWRWHVGGVDCDGGKVKPGQWIHVVATFDGRHARVFQNGIQVASKPCKPNLTPWSGPLFIGQYGPTPSPPYQVKGRIRDVKIYRRAISASEVRGNSAKPLPKGSPVP
jgi:hypothetical protein